MLVSIDHMTLQHENVKILSYFTRPVRDATEFV